MESNPLTYASRGRARSEVEWNGPQLFECLGLRLNDSSRWLLGVRRSLIFATRGLWLCSGRWWADRGLIIELKDGADVGQLSVVCITTPPHNVVVARLIACSIHPPLMLISVSIFKMLRHIPAMAAQPLVLLVLFISRRIVGNPGHLVPASASKTRARAASFSNNSRCSTTAFPESVSSSGRNFLAGSVDPPISS